MTRRKTTEEFIAESNMIHSNKYTYDNSVYVKAKTKLLITCRVHGDFPQTPDSHRNGNGCPKCAGNNYKTTEEFIDESSSVHGGEYDYSLVKYKNWETHVDIICKHHGVFRQIPLKHTQGHKCPKCAGFYRTTEEFIVEARAVHGDRYSYDTTEYNNSEDKLVITCKDHGEFKQTPHDHMRGGGCPKCVGLYKTTEEFIAEAKGIHFDRYGYSSVEYVNSKEKVNIFCNLHGIFPQTPSHHLQGMGCPKCSDYCFNEDKDSVFYVYTFGSYAGFGVTNCFKTRHKQHLGNFKKKGFDSSLLVTYNMSGKVAKSIENSLKSKMSIKNSGVKGFKTEAVDIGDIQALLLNIELMLPEVKSDDRHTKAPLQ